MIDFKNKAVFKLKKNDEYGEKVRDLLVEGEEIMESYKSMRDGVVFTNKRVIAVNVQGLTGKKIDYSSLPYRTVVAFSVETAGRFSDDAELDLYFSALGNVRFEFEPDTKVLAISKRIASHVL